MNGTLPSSMNLTIEQYSALVALARRGTTSVDQQVDLEAFLVQIEKANGVTRYLMWVQWQEAGQILPPTTKFPEVWPPQLRQIIQQLNRPIAKSDVQAVLTQFAANPTNVLVTADPAAQVGWQSLAQAFPGG